MAKLRVASVSVAVAIAFMNLLGLANAHKQKQSTKGFLPEFGTPGTSFLLDGLSFVFALILLVLVTLL